MIKLRDLLTEGRYDRAVTALSRMIIKRLKKGQKSFLIHSDDLEMEDRKKLMVGFFVGINLVNIDEFEHEIEIDPGEVHIEGYVDISNIYNIMINIDIYKNEDDSLKSVLNEIIFNLKDALRHEIQHISQDIRKFHRPHTSSEDIDKVGDIAKGKVFRGDLYNYFTDPDELSAWVHGIHKRAKTKKIPFSKAVDKIMKMALKTGNLSREEAKDVKDRWMKYAKRTFRKLESISENIIDKALKDKEIDKLWKSYKKSEKKQEKRSEFSSATVLREPRGQKAATTRLYRRLRNKFFDKFPEATDEDFIKYQREKLK